MLPGVFAVEDDEDRRLSPAGARTVAVAGFGQTPDEIVGGRLAAPPGVGEPDQIRERVVAKPAGDRIAWRSDPVGAVQQLRLLDVAVPVTRERAPDGARQDLFVGRHP